MFFYRASFWNWVCHIYVCVSLGDYTDWWWSKQGVWGQGPAAHPAPVPSLAKPWFWQWKNKFRVDMIGDPFILYVRSWQRSGPNQHRETWPRSGRQESVTLRTREEVPPELDTPVWQRREQWSFSWCCLVSCIYQDNFYSLIFKVYLRWLKVKHLLMNTFHLSTHLCTCIYIHIYTYIILIFTHIYDYSY